MRWTRIDLVIYWVGVVIRPSLQSHVSSKCCPLFLPSACSECVIMSPDDAGEFSISILWWWINNYGVEKSAKISSSSFFKGEKKHFNMCMASWCSVLQSSLHLLLQWLGKSFLCKHVWALIKSSVFFFYCCCGCCFLFFLSPVSWLYGVEEYR